MRNRAVRFGVSPALAVASLALAVSLGGTGYAAVKLPKNSVGPTQIRANAVTSPKVRNGALRLVDFARAERTRLKGDPGAVGPTGQTGPKGDKGDKGDPGAIGVSAWQRASGPPYSIQPGAAATLSHNCPAGKRAFGGGTLSNSPLGIVVSSWPSADSTWSVRVRNPTAAQITFQVWAVCAVVA